MAKSLQMGVTDHVLTGMILQIVAKKHLLLVFWTPVISTDFYTPQD